MTNRTTFFVAEITGPMLPDTFRTVAGHRAGTWKLESLLRLATRSGVTLKSAYSVPRDNKGFLNACKTVIL